MCIQAHSNVEAIAYTLCSEKTEDGYELQFQVKYYVSIHVPNVHVHVHVYTHYLVCRKCLKCTVNTFCYCEYMYHVYGMYMYMYM